MEERNAAEESVYLPKEYKKKIHNKKLKWNEV